MADKNAIIREAQKYLAKGQVDKAIAEWDKLIKEAPDGNVYNIIGDLYLKNADKKNAVESFHKSADFFRKDGFAPKAMALYKKVLNINPSDAAALLAIGELNEEKGLSTDAIKYFLASADSLSKEGKKDRLLPIYEKIISLSPENILLRNKIAEIYIKEGLKSNAATEYFRIARTCDEKGDLEKAKEYYKKTLDIQPLHKEATMGIGDIYERSGRTEQAVGHMRDAAALFPGDLDILFKYAEFLLAAGDSEGAEECLKKIKDLDPENVKARRMLGEMYLKAGSMERAWEEYLPAIDAMILEEKYDAAINLLGNFREMDPLETGKRLVSLYRQIGQTDHVVDELVRLGDAMKERGMDDNALTCYKDALELRPEDSRLQELVRGPVKEAEKEVITVHATESDKTVEEIFIETDIFSRYGLLSEAIKLLEGLKIREPQNIDLHMRLKSLYSDSGDKELAVTECLVLNELYKRQGDPESSDKMLQEAFEISPEDPRLADRGIMHSTYESTSFAGQVEAPGEELEVSREEKADIEDYDEEIAEADFYARQGLIQEAAKILERLHNLFPENRDVIERMDNLGQVMEETEEEMQLEYEAPQGEPAQQDITEEIIEPEKTAYEDFSFSDNDLVDAQEMPEPALDDDVLSIFHEFKKGLEKELGEEDSETHYNLGIAYKEMGLIDDAIQEFQTARNDPKRLVQASTMLGVCYMEKGMYSLAIDALTNVMNKIGEKDEAYWPLKYDLAEAYEKNNDLSQALELYTGVYGWNARFRSVAEKISQIRGAGVKEVVKDAVKEKPKERKDRVSYL